MSCSLRSLGLFLAGAALWCVACTSDDPQAADVIASPSEATESTPAPAPTPTATPTVAPAPTGAAEPDPAPQGLGSDLALPGERGRWTGTIDGTIGGEIWLAQEGDFVRGEIVYTSVGEPILLLGQRVVPPDGNEWYLLREFGSDGRVSGSMNLIDPAEGAIGSATWGEFEMVLNYQGVGDEPYFFDSANFRDGEYRYAFAPFLDDQTGGDTEEGRPCCGPSGELVISDISAATLFVSFFNVTSAPASHIAMLPPAEIPRDGNRALYENVDGDFMDCAVEIVLFDGFAFVDYVDERWECGFGNRAGVSGVYVQPGRFG